MARHLQIPTDDGTPFDPSRYLTKVGSADYLEVKWRLVWLREVDPDARIETEIISHQDQMAVFKATIRRSSKDSESAESPAVATGYGSESYNDFREYFEKAETKAIGRALAALGFGTQFCDDHDFMAGSPAGKAGVVDSPIDFASTRGRRLAGTDQSSKEYQSGPGVQGQSAAATATPRQLKYIEVIAREQGIDEDQLNAEAEQLYGRPIAQLERRDASAFIERLQSRRNMTELAT